MFFKLVHYLEGKKTYIISTAFALFNLALQSNVITLAPKTIVEINAVLAALGLGALRAAVAKNTPTALQ